MANPRAAIGHGDALHVTKTFKYDNTIVYDKTVAGGSASVGLACTTFGRADDTIGLVGADERVSGRIDIVEADGFCSVTTMGEVELPAGDGATVTVGSKIVGALGAASAEGYIKSVGAPTTLEPTLAQLNASNAARGEILNNDVTTAVWVALRD